MTRGRDLPAVVPRPGRPCHRIPTTSLVERRQLRPVGGDNIPVQTTPPTAGSAAPLNNSDAVQVDVAGFDQPGRLELLVTLRAPIPHVELTPLPEPVVVAVDVSGAVVAPWVHAAVAAMVRSASAIEARIGIVAFDDSARLVRPADRPITSASELTTVMPALVCGGRSNLAAGIARAVAEARRVLAAGAGTPRIVLLLAGEPDCGVTDLSLISRLICGAAADGIRVDVVAGRPSHEPPMIAHLARVARTSIRRPQDTTALTRDLAVLTGTDVAPAAVSVAATVRCLDGLDGPTTQPYATVVGSPHTHLDDRVQVADLGDLLRGERRTFAVGLDKGDDVWSPVAAAELEVAWTDAETMAPARLTFPIAFGLLPGEAPSPRETAGR